VINFLLSKMSVSDLVSQGFKWNITFWSKINLPRLDRRWLFVSLFVVPLDVLPSQDPILEIGVDAGRFMVSIMKYILVY
jgi:hypothetical protein